jgi:hypothetical protein
VSGKSFGGTFCFSNCHIIRLDTGGLVFLVSGLYKRKCISINAELKLIHIWHFHALSGPLYSRRAGKFSIYLAAATRCSKIKGKFQNESLLVNHALIKIYLPIIVKFDNWPIEEKVLLLSTKPHFWLHSVVRRLNLKFPLHFGTPCIWMCIQSLIINSRGRE